MNEESSKPSKIANNIQIINEIGPKMNVNNTLYLNTSVNPVNTSFEMKTDLDNLGKKIGNISIIKNTKPDHGNSQNEMEDILFKISENKIDHSFETQNQKKISFNQKKNTKNFDNSIIIDDNKVNKTVMESYCCNHEEELFKAKQKIELLSKKMKLVMEENKV